MREEKPTTKLCKHCQTEIPYKAKVCPNCRKKQGPGGCLIVVLVVLVLGLIGSVFGGGGDDKKSETVSAISENRPETTTAETETESETAIEYIVVTATELSDALSSNALKAQNDYKDKYLEISGTLGNIDSNGKYIGIDSDKDFDLTNIQCYLKTDEQKEIIMKMSKGDRITVRGYCADVGEIMGYRIDIDSIVE